MKKEAEHLYKKAVDSLILSIELFNRPNDCGRVHGVLIFLDHSFEMLLKAAIIHKGGSIRERGAKETMGFSSCIRKAFSDGKKKFLVEEDVLTLQAINGLRDAAQHYTLEISEQHLYFQAQAGLTLFRDVVKKVFEINLKESLPVRVLPLSTSPPVDIHTFFDTEVTAIKSLIKPGSRKTIIAREKLRALAVMENSIQGIESQPSNDELNQVIDKLKQGHTWSQAFPGVATLNLTTKGYGPSLDLRIVKGEGIPVHVVPEGTPGAAVVAIKRVNDLDFYSLNLTALSEKTNISANKLGAIIKEMKLQDEKESYKEFQIGTQVYKRYSPLALDKLKKEIPKLDIEGIWQKNRPKSGGRTRKKISKK